ncbi:prophage protein [Streptococcus pneumoniae]|nr:prophage protein [Streptococcus pneumoniae]CMW48898.1 prophage protein [Streptococcus pneumoniae]
MALKYTTWKVTDEKELKLRLTSHQAATVEEKIGMNLLKIFMPEAGEEFTLPPCSSMNMGILLRMSMIYTMNTWTMVETKQHS